MSGLVRNSRRHILSCRGSNVFISFIEAGDSYCVDVNRELIEKHQLLLKCKKKNHILNQPFFLVTIRFISHQIIL